MHAAVVNFSTAHGSVELREVSTPAIGLADVRIEPGDRVVVLGPGTIGGQAS